MDRVASGAATAGSARHGSARADTVGRHRPRVLAALAALTVALLLGPAPLSSGAGPGPDASGETVSLTGTAPGARLDVTLVRVTDPAGPAPDDADRLVSVQLHLENTGTAVYEDSPAAATHLMDSEGHRFTGASLPTETGAAGATGATGATGPGFPEIVILDPGSTATGLVAFRLPRDAGLAAVQFALDGGLANDVAQWSLA
ncbi:hypothetical protein M8Z33_29305 [Streptomyces sp. ZAF1911]|uniref:hypothetical protein n=1 Tax=Streptomyces sp. ZAF1911 TaxID=2944129 RepID=UPI00237A4F5C|nr:hypothetical protein [Streptomyces sp. ZAF1911]MDD9380680.1 hypothetical protein [Streptomyces sp. ZAF1911]